MTRLALALIVLLPVTAQADEAELLSFLGGHGCAIGPSNIDLITEAGFTADEVSALKVRGEAHGTWSVLPAEVCTIRVPDVQSDLTIAEIEPLFSAPDAYAEHGNPGCFLDFEKFTTQIAATRGWDADQVNAAYLSVMAQGIVSGEIRFYSDSPLRTPVGFQLTTGECSKVDGMEVIRANHPILIESFGAYIREVAPLVPCKKGETIMHPTWPEIMERLSGGENTNAWIAFEMAIITMGAGWYDGISATERGTPRPPICHYP